MTEPQLIVPVEGKYRAAELKSYEPSAKPLFPGGFNIRQVLSLHGDQINPSSLAPFGPTINLGELRFSLEARLCGGDYTVSNENVEFGSVTLYAMCKRIVEEGKRYAQQVQAPFVAVAAEMVTSLSGEIPLNSPIRRMYGVFQSKEDECLISYSLDKEKDNNQLYDLKEKPSVLTQKFLMSPTAQLYLPR